jgi:thiamine kinase-like enzyme
VLNLEKDLTAESVRKKQKLRTILTTIGDSLQHVFKDQIFLETKEKPNFVTIEDVQTLEKGTSKSKVHFVTYYLNSDIGKHLVNLVVKFSADETRFEKEINNYNLIATVPERFPGIYIPEIIYKSSQNRCIIYEGISGKSFRETQLDKDFKHQLAGQTLAAVHGISIREFNTEPYKKLILYLISTLHNKSLEDELLELMLASLFALENSKGSTMIHGDFHQGNLLFSSEITAPLQEIVKEFPPKIKVFIIDPEFVKLGRDRSEDIGTFFAKPCMYEFKKYGTVDDTVKNVDAFLKGYDFALKGMGADFRLKDLYPQELTIDFHVATYLLYDINEKIQSRNLDVTSEELSYKLELLRKLLTEKPFNQIM